MSNIREKISIVKLGHLNASMMLTKLLDSSIFAIDEMEKSNPDIAEDIAVSALEYISGFMSSISINNFIDMVKRRIENEEIQETVIESLEKIIQESKKNFKILLKGEESARKKFMKKFEKFFKEMKKTSGCFDDEEDDDEIASFGSEDMEVIGSDSFDDLDPDAAPILEIEWNTQNLEIDTQQDNSISDYSDFTSFQNIDSGFMTPQEFNINPFEIKFNQGVFQVDEITDECCFAMKNSNFGVIASANGEIVKIDIEGREGIHEKLIKSDDLREFSDIAYSKSFDVYLGYCSKKKNIFSLSVKGNNDEFRDLCKARLFGDFNRKIKIDNKGKFLFCRKKRNSVWVFRIEDLLNVSNGKLPTPALKIKIPFEERITDFKVLNSNSDKEVHVLILTLSGNLTLLRGKIGEEEEPKQTFYQFGFIDQIQNSGIKEQFSTLAVCPMSESIAVVSSHVKKSCRHTLYWLKISAQDYSLNLINTLPISSQDYCSSIYALEFQGRSGQQPILFARPFWTQDSYLTFFFDEDKEEILDLKSFKKFTGTNEYCRSVISFGKEMMSLSRYGKISIYHPNFEA